MVDPVLDFTLDLDDDLVKLAWESTQVRSVWRSMAMLFSAIGRQRTAYILREPFPPESGHPESTALVFIPNSFDGLYRLQAMDRFTSPVFLSVDERGELREGLGGVPDHKEGRSIIFVGNHQLLGIDMPILVRVKYMFDVDDPKKILATVGIDLPFVPPSSESEASFYCRVVFSPFQVRKILTEKDICVRGLAHPAVSGTGTERFMEKLRQQQEADRQQVGAAHILFE